MYLYIKIELAHLAIIPIYSSLSHKTNNAFIEAHVQDTGSSYGCLFPIVGI